MVGASLSMINRCQSHRRVSRLLAQSPCLEACLCDRENANLGVDVLAFCRCSKAPEVNLKGERVKGLLRVTVRGCLRGPLVLQFGDCGDVIHGRGTGEQGCSPPVSRKQQERREPVHQCSFEGTPAMASPLPARSHRFFSHLRLETKPLTHGLWGVPEDQAIAAG